ncbi:MAG: hypothetical protein HY221_01435 [Candidatus Sungbacteria bacterium]|uniref:PilN domain-containing protein n=1 Tax=Candidatus Sungiibacteriota bacterium TaxID=2750080 RepID=A0A932QY47_9BACT|nr:hypothetical protein [Candidatus Sungbacteria bacterium]
MLMTNLLPPEEKKSVLIRKAERGVRLFALWAILVSVGGAVLLLPSYVRLVRERRFLRRLADLEQGFAATSGLPDQAALIRNDTRKIARVQNFVATPPKAVPLLGAFTEDFPDISLEEVAIRHDGNVTIRGTARTRTALLAFEKMLRDANRFDSIAFPLSAILQEANVHFNINAVLKPMYRL